MEDLKNIRGISNWSFQKKLRGRVLECQKIVQKEEIGKAIGSRIAKKIFFKKTGQQINIIESP